MIDIGMYVALGFLLASLLALIVAPAFWRRAVRLTKRRIEMTMPMSASDIQADKDQLRAEFAIELRRVVGNRFVSPLAHISQNGGHRIGDFLRHHGAATELSKIGFERFGGERQKTHGNRYSKTSYWLSRRGARRK